MNRNLHKSVRYNIGRESSSDVSSSIHIVVVVSSAPNKNDRANTAAVVGTNFYNHFLS